jgi:hypothetical protein
MKQFILLGLIALASSGSQDAMAVDVCVIFASLVLPTNNWRRRRQRLKTTRNPWTHKRRISSKIPQNRKYDDGDAELTKLHTRTRFFNTNVRDRGRDQRSHDAPWQPDNVKAGQQRD